MDSIRTNADMLTYARRVRRVLKKRKITQQDLAKFIDVPTSKIGRILNWKPDKYKINDSDRELVSLINNCLNLEPVNPCLNDKDLNNLFSRIDYGGLRESDYDNIRYYLYADYPGIESAIENAAARIIKDIDTLRNDLSMLRMSCRGNVEDTVEMLELIKNNDKRVTSFSYDLYFFKEYFLLLSTPY